MMKAGTIFGSVVGGIILTCLLGLSTGGFPANPTFQSVMARAGSTFGPFLMLQDGAGNNQAIVGIAGAASQMCGTGTAQNDLCIRSNNHAVRLSLDNGATSIALGASTAPVVCTATCSAATIAVGQTYTIFKPANTARSSTAVLANDPDLMFTAVPVGRYEISFMLSIDDSASATPGWQVGTVCTGTCVNTPALGYSCIANSLSSYCGPSGGYNWPQAPAIALGSGQSTFSMLMVPGQIQVTGAGNIGISWAQNTSTAVNTIMLSSTWLKLTRIL